MVVVGDVARFYEGRKILCTIMESCRSIIRDAYSFVLKPEGGGEEEVRWWWGGGLGGWGEEGQGVGKKKGLWRWIDRPHLDEQEERPS